MLPRLVPGETSIRRIPISIPITIFARARGFPGAIMSASQVVPHLHEALIEAVGEATFFGGGTQLRYKMIRPVASEGRATVRVLEGDAPDSLELRVEDENGQLCIVGNATLRDTSS